MTSKSPFPVRHQQMARRRTKRLDSGTKPLPKIATSLRTNEVFGHLQQLLGVTCSTNGDKFQILQKRDELLSILRNAGDDFLAKSKHTQGTCPDMCPEKERYMRQHKRDLHPYECDEATGRAIPEKMVKDYSRSAADQDAPMAHELRPLNVLRVTMDYLLYNIAHVVPTTSSDLAKWYDFLWTRTRAIRKDITQQMLESDLAVDLIEKCVRLHAFASFRLVHLDIGDFNQKMNTENLSKSLQTLRHMYDDLAKKGVFCNNEAEFRSYDIILNLSDHNVHSQVLSYRQIVRESSEVQLALMMATSLQNNNYIRFFRLAMHSATFLQACLCYRYFNMVRSAALKVICLAFSLFPVAKFKENLAFDSTDAATHFLDLLHIELDNTDPNFINTRDGRVILTSGSDIPSSDSLPQPECRWLEQKTGDLNLTQILCNTTTNIPRERILTQISKPVNSFTETQQYLKDPVLKDFLESNGIDLNPVSSSDGRPRTLASLDFESNKDKEKKKDTENKSHQPKALDDFFQKSTLKKSPPSSLKNVSKTEPDTTSSFNFKSQIGSMSQLAQKPMFSSLFDGRTKSQHTAFGLSKFESDKSKPSTSFLQLNKPEKFSADSIFKKNYETKSSSSFPLVDPRLRTNYDQTERTMSKPREVFIDSVAKQIFDSFFPPHLEKIISDASVSIFTTKKTDFEKRIKRKNELVALKTQIFNSVVESCTSQLLESLAKDELRKAKCEGSRVFANCFAQHFSGVILDEAAHSIIAQTSRQLHNEFRLGIEKQLFKIRLNLQKEWIRQFAHRWMSVTRNNKLLREIGGINHATDFLQQPLVQQHLYNPNPNQGILLTPERIHLKVYLRHFRKARQDFLLRKYFAKWCDFVFRRRHLKQIQDVLVRPDQQTAITKSPPGLFRHIPNDIIQFPPPPNWSYHTEIGRKHLLERRSFSPQKFKAKIPRLSGSFQNNSIFKSGC